MGSVEMEVFVDNTDEIMVKLNHVDVAFSDIVIGEVPFVASLSLSCSEKASAKVSDDSAVVSLIPAKDNCQTESSLIVIPAEQNGLDLCTILPERPIGRISPIDCRNAEPVVPSAAAAETGSDATGSGKFQPFIPRRMMHRRHDSVSGEIPVHSQKHRYEARNERTYEYDQEVPSMPSRGRPRYRQQLEQLDPDHQDPCVNQDLSWQGMGTVYASEETYSFRRGTVGTKSQFELAEAGRTEGVCCVVCTDYTVLKIESWPRNLRFMMLSKYVGQFIGRHGSNIKNIVNSSGVVSISVEQDYVVDKTNQVVNVYGDRETCDAACYEILKFLFFMDTGLHAEDCPDGTVQLILLANDDYCGMLIGRDGRSLRQMREESDTRISFAKLLGDSRYMELYPERIVFVSGLVRNVVLAQSEITTKQYNMRLHEADSWQTYGSRRPNISRTMLDLDNNTICDIIIDNDVAGAVIGRRGANIKTIMTKSQALVSVLPKIGELEMSETRRYVRIAGSHDGVFRASYMVFLYVTRALSDKPKMDALVLDSQLLVPSLSVGHIIGKRGHRVRNIESKTNVKIYVLNAPQPPPSPSGSGRSRVKISGNFWNTQAAIRELLKVVNNAGRRSNSRFYVHDQPAYPVRQRRASLSTARELDVNVPYDDSLSVGRSQETSDLPITSNGFQSASKRQPDQHFANRLDYQIEGESSRRPSVVFSPSAQLVNPVVNHHIPEAVEDEQTNTSATVKEIAVDSASLVIDASALVGEEATQFLENGVTVATENDNCPAGLAVSTEDVDGSSVSSIVRRDMEFQMELSSSLEARERKNDASSGAVDHSHFNDSHISDTRDSHVDDLHINDSSNSHVDSHIDGSRNEVAPSFPSVMGIAVHVTTPPAESSEETETVSEVMPKIVVSLAENETAITVNVYDNVGMLKSETESESSLPSGFASVKEEFAAENTVMTVTEVDVIEPGGVGGLFKSVATPIIDEQANIVTMGTMANDKKRVDECNVEGIDVSDACCEEPSAKESSDPIVVDCADLGNHDESNRVPVLVADTDLALNIERVNDAAASLEIHEECRNELLGVGDRDPDNSNGPVTDIGAHQERNGQFESEMVNVAHAEHETLSGHEEHVVAEISPVDDAKPLDSIAKELVKSPGRDGHGTHLDEAVAGKTHTGDAMINDNETPGSLKSPNELDISLQEPGANDSTTDGVVVKEKGQMYSVSDLPSEPDNLHECLMKMI